MHNYVTAKLASEGICSGRDMCYSYGIVAHTVRLQRSFAKTIVQHLFNIGTK